MAARQMGESARGREGACQRARHGLMIFFRVSSSVSSHSVAAAAYSTSNFLQSSVLPSARVVRRKKKSVPNTAARAPDSLGVVADIESNIEATSTDGDAHALLLEMMHTATGQPGTPPASRRISSIDLVKLDLREF